MLRGGGPGGESGVRVGQHRVAAVGELRGAGVVGAAFEGEPPPAVRPDAFGQAEGGAQGGQRAALLDVQLDDRAEVRQQVVAGARAGGVVTAAAMASASVVPPVSVRARAASGAMAPVSRRLPRQGTPNRAPSSSVKTASTTDRSG